MAPITDPMTAIKLTIKGFVAIITIDVPQKLNALTQPCYFRIAVLLHEVAAMDDISVTVVTGNGRFFSAGADVTSTRPADGDLRLVMNQNFVSNNLHNTHAWMTHPKILVAALNGPVVGISAANISHADFIYAAPHTFLLTPFTSLGLVAEGGASRSFIERMGLSKANEALLMSKRISCEELVRCGFVNQVFSEGGGDKATGKGIDTVKFMDRVMHEIHERLGTHLNHYAMMKIKAQIRKHSRDQMELANYAEVWGGLDVFMKGVPQKEFARIASGEKRHKL